MNSSSHSSLSDTVHRRSRTSRQSASTLPSTPALSKPMLPVPGLAKKAEESVLSEVYELRNEIQPQPTSLFDALTAWKAVYPWSTSISSSSSSEVDFVWPAREIRAPDTAPSGRIVEWRETLESAYPIETPLNTPSPLHSPLLSFDFSPRSDIALEEEYHLPDDSLLPQLPTTADRDLSYLYDQDEAATQPDEDEDTMWPYDGRGLYEHHSTRDCGYACFVSCQLRRRFRPRLTRLTQLVLGSKNGRRSKILKMRNSDIPHPPWKLQYRSNDDSLEEDHDDGDLELWLESITEKHKLDHRLRFRLHLDGNPDSRIFS